MGGSALGYRSWCKDIKKNIFTPPLPPISFLLVNNTPFQCMKMKWNYVNCRCRIHQCKILAKMQIFSELIVHELEIHCFLRPDSRFSWYLGWVWFSSTQFQFQYSACNQIYRDNLSHYKEFICKISSSSSLCAFLLQVRFSTGSRIFSLFSLKWKRWGRYIMNVV